MQEFRAKQLQDAELIADYEGPLYCEGVGNGSYGESFFENLRELQEHLDFHEGSAPEFAFACTCREGIAVSIGSILEDAVQELYEDAMDDLSGVDELEAAVEIFNKANASMRTFDVDYKRKVAIPRDQAPA